jgi:uncharacterized protein with GYD domain
VATYIQLLVLTPEGREKTLRDPQFVLREQHKINVPGVRILGQYGVLGEYDFVNIVEAPDNESVARFSIELGVRAGAHIVTLPAIPVARLEAPKRPADLPGLESEVTMTPPAPARRGEIPGFRGRPPEPTGSS